ncbi:Transmembrane protein [Phytophthora cinnamomi]|uniref:Transmembrane protein n=1 Tax=Phytophthora cinnamomi TaxID=4785 RepID=UPI0035595FA3|nr:Transmembrane protein [Phytophthora cinnamomi]
MVVASPPRKSRFRSQDASVDHVYLKSTWVVTSLRHPALRVLCCLAHTLVCLYVGVASPLLTSLKTPASFPVYGSIVRAFGTGFTWQKLIFQSVLSTSLLLLLRLVAYPRLVQRQWNWESSFHHATQTFSRLSRASASDGHGDAIQTATTDQRRVLALQTFTAGGASAAPAVRSQVWNVGASHGSWTFVAATFPFFWATAVTQW